MRPHLSTVLPSAGEMKLLRKSSKVPLRLEVGIISLLQGKAGAAENVCPEASLLQGDFINVPEGRAKRLSQALLNGVPWWDWASGCNWNRKLPWNIRKCFLHCIISTGRLSRGVMESPHFRVIQKHFGHSHRQISRGGHMGAVGLDQMIPRSSFQNFIPTSVILWWKDHIFRLKTT